MKKKTETTQKITFAKTESITRMKAIKQLLDGATQAEVAKEFNVHDTTIGEWLKLYNEKGVEALNIELRPREKHVLDAKEIETAITLATDEKEKKTLGILLELANGVQLKSLALKYAISAQMIMKYRKKYIETLSK